MGLRSDHGGIPSGTELVYGNKKIMGGKNLGVRIWLIFRFSTYMLCIAQLKLLSYQFRDMRDIRYGWHAELGISSLRRA